MLLLQYALPTWKKAIPIMILFAMTLTSVPPIIDWIVSGGRGISMAYLAQSPMDMAYSFLTFFGPFAARGITVGIRIELAAMIVGIGALVYLVRKSVWRSFATMFVLYAVMFFSVAMPGVLSAIAGLFGGGASSPNQFLISSMIHSSTLADNIHGTLRYVSLQRMLEIGFDFMLGRIWFLATVALGGAWFFTNFRRQATVIFRNSRPDRVAMLVLLIIFGTAAAYYQGHFFLNWNDLLALATLFLSFYFAWMFAVCVNDIFDTDIDRISNAARPLLDGGMSVSHMKSASFLFLVLSLVGGYLCGYYAFFCILTFTALYYIYSAPPVRLKRVPFLSVVIIGFCSLTVVMAGFFTFSVSITVSAFPASLIIGIVVMFSFLSQVKDIKDIEGDRAAGIMTLPVILGPIWGPRIVGGLAALAYMVAPFVIGRTIVFFVAVPAAVITYWFAIRKPYIERPIFVVYGIFILFLAAIFLD
jgi:4-hydroxybenzoate polyprenyltransferase